MNDYILPQPYRDLLYLVCCALNEKSPEADRLRRMDLAQVYGAAKAHSMTAIAAMAIESCSDYQEADPELTRKWKESKEKAIWKNLLLDAERTQILNYLESEGIWYMPLKGSVLKDLYPKYGMREMADNDILFDPAGREKLFAFMTGRGYTGTLGNGDTEDVYHKPPVFVFELHCVLFGRTHDPVWRTYYENVKDRLEPDPGKEYGCHFRDEDFYLYLAVHTCKHYKGAGTGLRILADTYVFLQKRGAELDWDYLRKEAEKLGIAEFEEQIRLLSQKLLAHPDHFYDTALTEREEEFLSFLSGCGTYGTLSNLLTNQLSQMECGEGSISRKTRLRYLRNRLFPDTEWFERNMPFFARHRILIPFFWIYRIFRGVIHRRKQITQEARAVRTAGRTENKH